MPLATPPDLSAAPREVDFVIVGGGSAGCVLANRLSADPANLVTLLEAGLPDRWQAWSIHMPAAYGKNFQGGAYTYSYNTEPEPHLGGRRIFQPRGKVLGGSSGINGMCYTRASPVDYERWAAEGAAGWSYAEVLPYFKKLESTETGDDLYRGRNGPVKVVAGPCAFGAYEAFFEAGRQAGYPETPDINGYQQEGFSRFERNIDGGVRASASWAYLRPVRGRPNLTIETRAAVLRILVERGRAVGVDYSQHGRTIRLRARREVILTAGAINTPQILQISGIGDPDDLSAAGIAPVHELRGVGKNLQDHYEFYLSWTCSAEASLNRKLTLWGKAAIGMEWVLTRKGLGASNHCEAVAFVKSDDALGYPDVQLQFMPLQLASGLNPQSRPGGFCITIAHQRPRNRGTVSILTADPRQAPAIRVNYLATEYDRAKARRCIEIARDLIARRAFDPIRGTEMKPGPDVRSPAEIDAFCAGTGTSGYHASGTCRMGPADDDTAVVTPDGLVRGLSGLRIADASIFPSLTTGNTNAPVMMIAEKLSDVILGRAPLPALNAPFAGELRPDV